MSPFFGHAPADGALATSDQNLVSLPELRVEQAIERIGNMNLKMAALSMRLSHASFECEKRIQRGGYDRSS